MSVHYEPNYDLSHPVFRLGRYVWPALMVWALDRTFRLCRVLLFNIPFLHRNTSPSSLEILSSDVVRLTVRRRHLSWSPGQTMFVSLPDISHLPIESHPFTIASIDSTMGQNLGERELVFIIRGRNGFTGRLRDVARDHSGRNVNVVLDGPYGCPPNLASFETVVLISGKYIILILEGINSSSSFLFQVELELHIVCLCSLIL